MNEESLQAPTRHPIPWQDEAFYDEELLDAELRRVFDVCHGCRRCFNLCDSFPRLFDLIDQTETGELPEVASESFSSVVDACTLCDMCFMTKCPYVPPHSFNIDFPHLMLRHRAVEHRKGHTKWSHEQLCETDRNGKLSAPVAPVVNWLTAPSNKLSRTVMEKAVGVDRRAALPVVHRETFVQAASQQLLKINEAAPAFGRKAVIYATCFANYNNPDIGLAARQVLAKNGVFTEVVYPECCGMPQLECGDLARVAGKAKAVSTALLPWIEQGYDVIALIPSCALMLKFEWPLICPDDEGVKRLSAATFDMSEYVVDIAKTNGLAPDLISMEGVTVHIACHARAQNMGQKAAEMLRLIPETNVEVVERCSGHGGAWGIFKENFDVAMKVGRPVARQVAEKDTSYVTSECPLAGMHIAQGVAALEGKTIVVTHPIELMALAYGFEKKGKA